MERDNGYPSPDSPRYYMDQSWSSLSTYRRLSPEGRRCLIEGYPERLVDFWTRHFSSIADDVRAGRLVMLREVGSSLLTGGVSTLPDGRRFCRFEELGDQGKLMVATMFDPTQETIGQVDTTVRLPSFEYTYRDGDGSYVTYNIVCMAGRVEEVTKTIKTDGVTETHVVRTNGKV